MPRLAHLVSSTAQPPGEHIPPQQALGSRSSSPDSGEAGLIHLCFSSPGAPVMFGGTQAHAAPCWHTGSPTRWDLSHSPGKHAHAHTCTHMYTHVHACTHTRAAHVCTPMHAHTHTGAHTHRPPHRHPADHSRMLGPLPAPPRPSSRAPGLCVPSQSPSSPDIAGSTSSQSQSD